MSLRIYLKGIADALRSNGANNEPINAQDFSYKIYEIAEYKHSAGMAEGYNRGQEVGYENGHEEGYNKGYLDASPQETVSGEAIAITDISPIEHNMGVKISGVEDISTVKLYKQGKNLIKFPNVDKSINADYTPGVTKTLNGVTFTVNDDGSIYAKGTATGNAYLNLVKKDLKLEENYTLQGGSSGKTVAECNISISKRITYQQVNNFIYVYIPKGVTIDEVLYPQLEYGLSQTKYEPYIEPVIYDVNADGTVEGVKSLYPNTTLYTDTQGAVIDCTYYQDGKKVKENLIDMILELGGVINE